MIQIVQTTGKDFVLARKVYSLAECFSMVRNKLTILENVVNKGVLLVVWG